MTNAIKAIENIAIARYGNTDKAAAFVDGWQAALVHKDCECHDQRDCTGACCVSKQQGAQQPVAWMYTLEYGAAVADTKVSVRQLNYPFGVCGADYLAKNDDGVSYVRQTPLYKAQSVPDSLLAKLPGGKKTDQWDSARVADYNQGWNDYRKAVKAVLAGAAPAAQPLSLTIVSSYKCDLDAVRRDEKEKSEAWLKQHGME